MKHLAIRSSICLLVIGLASGAFAQGLGEAAKSEAERRAKPQAEKPAKAYSGEDLANAKGGTLQPDDQPVDAW